MTYTVLKGDRIRISLERFEMIKLFGSKEKILNGSGDTRTIIKMLLKKAVTDLGFKADTSGVTVEIVGNISGGCDLYFIKENNRLSVKSKALKPVVFEFKSCQDAVLAARKFILSEKTGILTHFFKTENGFRLIAPKGLTKKQINLFESFAQKVYFLDLAVALTEEYGKELILNSAVLTLSKF